MNAGRVQVTQEDTAGGTSLSDDLQETLTRAVAAGVPAVPSLTREYVCTRCTLPAHSCQDRACTCCYGTTEGMYQEFLTLLQVSVLSDMTCEEVAAGLMRLVIEKRPA